MLQRIAKWFLGLWLDQVAETKPPADPNVDPNADPDVDPNKDPNADPGADPNKEPPAPKYGDFGDNPTVDDVMIDR